MQWSEIATRSAFPACIKFMLFSNCFCIIKSTSPIFRRAVAHSVLFWFRAFFEMKRQVVSIKYFYNLYNLMVISAPRGKGEIPNQQIFNPVVFGAVLFLMLLLFVFVIFRFVFIICSSDTSSLLARSHGKNTAQMPSKRRFSKLLLRKEFFP